MNTPQPSLPVELALDAMSDVVVVFDKDYRIVYHNEANRTAMRQAGVDPAGVLGQVVWDAMPLLAGTAGERETRRAMEHRVHTEWDEVFHPNVRLKGRAFPTADGGLLIVARNTTAEWHAELTRMGAMERATRAYALARGLATAMTPADVAQVVLGESIAAFGVHRGSMGAVSSDGEYIESLGWLGYTEAQFAPWLRYPLKGIGSPTETAILTGQPVFLESAADIRAAYPRLAATIDANRVGALAVLPVAYGGHTCAAIGLTWETPRTISSDERDFMLAFASQAGQALERTKLFTSLSAEKERAERAERRTSLLAETVGALTTTLAIEDAMRALARIPVPEIADYTMVYRRGADGLVHRVALHHRDPAKEWILHALEERFPLPADSEIPAARVVRTNEPLFIPNMSMADVVRGSTNPEYIELVSRLNLCSGIVLPLTARGRAIGALVLAMSDSNRHYTDEDYGVALALGERAAVALDNIALLEEATVARADAEAANRAKMDFLAKMSHELRTPLNAIGGYAELLELGVHGPMPPAQIEVLSRIRRSQHHLLGLINDVLNYAKLDAGKVEYIIADARLHDAIAEVEALVTPQLAAKRIAFAHGPECDELVVRTDMEKTQQILLNLLSNAVKFTPAGGRVSVMCRTAGTHAEVHVADTGVGIPAEKLDQIFEPFVQVGRSLTTPSEGTGLGLAISRELARAMGGDLTVTSELGKGSEFVLSLPLAAT